MSTQASARPVMPPAPRGVASFFAETTALYTRSLRKLMRRPVVLYFSLIQPVIWLMLFGQIFNRITQFPGAAQAFGGKSYFQFFVPAVVLQTILFAGAQSGIGIINDIDSGFLDKLLTTPIHRLAILLGKVLGDLTRMILQGAIIVGIAWLAGQLQSDPVRYAHGLPGVLAALGIALLFGLALAGFNVFVALKTRSTEATFLISNFFTLPLLFTSSAQLPLQLLPGWLQTVARLNPVTYAIDSMRLLLNGQQSTLAGSGASLIVQTVAVLGLLVAVALTLGVRAFHKSVST